MDVSVVLDVVAKMQDGWSCATDDVADTAIRIGRGFDWGHDDRVFIYIGRSLGRGMPREGRGLYIITECPQ